MTIKIDAISTLTAGLARQESQATKAAQDINEAAAKAQEVIAAARISNIAVMPPVTDMPVIVTGGDIITPLVSLLQAKTSYAVETKALKVTADLERDTVNALGQRSKV